jgi:hypothetical protein
MDKRVIARQIAARMQNKYIPNPERWAFKIPNNESGRELIQTLREFLNKESYYLRPRGRGSRKLHGNKEYLPLKYAEYFAVYLNPK